jgi:tryptophan synthase alpha subunit
MGSKTAFAFAPFSVFNPPSEAAGEQQRPLRHQRRHVPLVLRDNHRRASEDRVEYIVKRGTGLTYYFSREGVTGMQEKVSDTIGQKLSKIRTHTDLPIAVGFGISTPEQAKLVAQYADAIVVGSVVVNQIASHGTSCALVPQVSRFVRSLKTGDVN